MIHFAGDTKMRGSSFIEPANVLHSVCAEYLKLDSLPTMLGPLMVFAPEFF